MRRLRSRWAMTTDDEPTHAGRSIECEVDITTKRCGIIRQRRRRLRLLTSRRQLVMVTPAALCEEYDTVIDMRALRQEARGSSAAQRRGSAAERSSGDCRSNKPAAASAGSHLLDLLLLAVAGALRQLLRRLALHLSTRVGSFS